MWRSLLRSSVSIARHAADESAKARRRQVREQARFERAHNEQIDGYLHQAEMLDRQIMADAISALALRYVEGRGVAPTLPAGREAGAAARLLPERAPAPPIVLYQGDVCRLTLLDLRVAPFGVVGALLVEATQQVRLDVIRKSDPKKSPLFLADRASGSYLYPRTTSLPGVVVAGMPTVGLVVFEPVRMPVTALEVHAAAMKLGSDPFTFAHTYAPPWLGHESVTALAAPTVHQQAERQLIEEEQRRRAAEDAAREQRREASNRTGRAIAIVFGVIMLGSCAAAVCGSIDLDSTERAPAAKAPARTAPAKPRK